MTLQSHLATGATTVCRCWAVYRKDGVVLGFTDHDLDLWFEGVLFRAGSGLSSGALAQATGLAVDNAEAVGALSDASVSEADLRAGRYDEAEVRLWLVNWADTSERRLQFRGSLGEVSCAAGQFRAELRGLTEALNRPHRRVYQRDCGAVLGDRRCGVVLGVPQWSAEVAMMAMVDSVPAGQYGKEALESLGLWPAVEGSVAQSENVRAALTLVATGEAPFGIVYASDAVADDSVSVVASFPEDSHAPITYPAALLNSAADPADRAFLEALSAAAADAKFAEQGFLVLN